MCSTEEIMARALAYRDAWQANRAIPSDAPSHLSGAAHSLCAKTREALFAALPAARREDVDTDAYSA